MTNKETLFFIAKCLTISLEEKNRNEIELILKTTDMDWEEVVKASTSHYVLPAMYCNFKRADFLKYLPADLAGYMKYITDLNRDRNKQIIQQAKKLNSLLLDNDIRPIFLKGTGNILEGLYQDIGERMVGDIDFLFSEKDFFKAIDILKNYNYCKQENALDYFSGVRHYSRLVKEENIAAVEIHKEVTIEKHRGEFNCKMISEDAQLINDFSVLSFENQLSLSIISIQINDYGFDLKKFSLRNAYDVFLLSKKVNTKKTISNFTELKSPLNCFLAICYVAFGEINSLEYHKTEETDNYLSIFDSLLLNERKRKSRIKLKYAEFFIKKRLSILYKSLFYKEYRDWVLKRVLDKNWQREKMVQLGLKKRK